MTPEERAAQLAAKWYSQPFGSLADPERALALFMENAISVAVAEAVAGEREACLRELGGCAEFWRKIDGNHSTVAKALEGMADVIRSQGEGEG